MVVDDDSAVCDFLGTFLTDLGYEPITMRRAEEAIRRYDAERPDAVILDIMMPGGMDGLSALASIKDIDRRVPVIVLSGQGRTTTVVRAMKLGAFDFMSKPFDAPGLELLLSMAIDRRQRERDVALLRDRLQSHSAQYMLFSKNPQMQAVHELLQRAATTDVTVLVRGESGTGKELVARAIYATSLRRDRPFVKVNCAALPHDLLESELFGFERGAFTGAIREKPGKFEFANRGTIFLDEIGEMHIAIQAKLLQVLQDGEFTRLGGKHDVSVDVRLIAATNRDLKQAVAAREFRDDLYFRLNVVTIDLPPLRERRDEIAVLSDYFIDKYSRRYKRPFTEISADTMRLFMDYQWPGNVRELENLIKRMVVLGTEAPVRREIMLGLSVPGVSCSCHGPALVAPVQVPAPLEPPSAPPLVPAPASALAAPDAPPPAPAPDIDGTSLKDVSRHAAREAERRLILRTLERTRWNRKQTAHLLGISYKALLYKIRDSKLDQVAS